MFHLSGYSQIKSFGVLHMQPILFLVSFNLILEVLSAFSLASILLIEDTCYLI